MKFMTKTAAEAAEKTAAYVLPGLGLALPVAGMITAETPGAMAAGLVGGHFGHHLGRITGAHAGERLLGGLGGAVAGHDLGGLAGELLGQYGGQHLVNRYNRAQDQKRQRRMLLAGAGLAGATALGGLGLHRALSHDDEK